MTADDLEMILRVASKRRPYRRFLIEFVSGDRILIAHPETMDRRGDLFIFRGPDNGSRIFSAESVCQVIDPPPAAPPG
jgi:hypothetical protein